jgi:LemA protein
MSIESSILILGLVGLACIVWLHLLRLSELDALCDWANATLSAHNARRHALLLDLLKALRAFSLDARDAVESVAIVRAAAIRAATPQARLQAETRLDREVRRLLSLAETSPVLRNSCVFAELSSQIAQNQEDIVAARDQSAAFVNSYNRVRKNFPGDWLAARLRYAQRAIHSMSQEIGPEALPETGGEAA